MLGEGAMYGILHEWEREPGMQVWQVGMRVWQVVMQVWQVVMQVWQQARRHCT